MYRVLRSILTAGVVTTGVIVGAAEPPAAATRRGAQSQAQTIDLAQAHDARKLRVINREVTKIQERNGVRLSAKSGNGVAWLEGSDFRSGTIEVDVRGKEDMQQSFVGVAFHRKDDNTYEAVYLRPFNFRAQDHHMIGSQMRLGSSGEVTLDERWRDHLTPGQARVIRWRTRRYRELLGYA